MQIGGHDFRGPFRDTTAISDAAIGTYVVICFVDDEPHCVLDIGTVEGGNRATVTDTANLRYRLRYHNREQCWQRHVHGEIRYCVKHITDDDTRLSLEDELKWKFEHPCGVNHMADLDPATDQYDEYRSQFGPQGSYELTS